jgi:predicted ATP-grasp superfamily ATP-dependent carboligase
LVKTFSTPAEPAEFVMNLKSLGMNILGLGYESGPTGYELAWECQQEGIPEV